MPEFLTNLFHQIAALPPGRRAILGVTAAGSLAFFAWIGSGATSPAYRAAWRGLPEQEVGRIVDALASEGISYELAEGGTAVWVPEESVHEARIRLAGRGLPSGAGAGFELFDKPSFGVTDFVHRVNYARAVQGELARSIEQLDPVSRARVQVVIPEYRGVLSASRRRPSASVVLRMEPGRELVEDQVRSVVHLVASSIEALEPKDVTVVDDRGRLLAPMGDAGGSGLSTAGSQSYRARLEADLVGRVETILGRVVGPDRVVARVHADLDWTERETTKEIFDPDSQVSRSEHRTTEASTDESGSTTEGGVPGVAANTPDGTQVAEVSGSSGPSSESTRTSETLNFEISKTIQREIEPRGSLERLSVAVLVAEPLADAAGEGEAAPEAWSEEDMALFESLAKQAVGFDEKRGDQITVSSAPFRVPVTKLDDGFFVSPQVWIILGHVLRGLALLVALFLFARLVVKPVLEAVAGNEPSQLPARVAQLEAQLAGAMEGSEGGGALGGGDLAELPAGVRRESAVTEDSVKALKGWLSQS